MAFTHQRAASLPHSLKHTLPLISCSLCSNKYPCLISRGRAIILSLQIKRVRPPKTVSGLLEVIINKWLNLAICLTPVSPAFMPQLQCPTLIMPCPSVPGTHEAMPPTSLTLMMPHPQHIPPRGSSKSGLSSSTSGSL